MNKHTRQSIVGSVVGLLLVSGAPAAPPAAPDTATKARVEAAFGQLPLLFIENRGQLDPTVAYYVQGRRMSLYFTPGGLTFALLTLYSLCEATTILTWRDFYQKRVWIEEQNRDVKGLPNQGLASAPTHTALK